MLGILLCQAKNKSLCLKQHTTQNRLLKADFDMHTKEIGLHHLLKQVSFVSSRSLKILTPGREQDGTLQ